jgi:hypothetical protein
MNNRLSHLFQSEPVAVSAPGPRPLVPMGFAVCPMGLMQGAWQQQLYQAAYERARALLAPPRTHRLLNLECWN